MPAWLAGAERVAAWGEPFPAPAFPLGKRERGIRFHAVPMAWGPRIVMKTRKREEFIGKLQERYGLAKEAAQKQADEWLRTQHEVEASTGRL